MNESELNDSAQGSRLPKTARQDRIVAELGVAPMLRASELASVLGVSHETIRRDLVELDGRGLLNRTYGGAARPFTSEPPMRERSKHMIEERRRIASAVASHIEENSVVLIGAGATTQHVASSLAAKACNITAITHDFTVAQSLSRNPTIRVLFLPGRAHMSEGYVFGQQTLNAIENYRAHWAIVGATSIDEAGLYDADDEAAAIFRAMILKARRSIVAVDSRKFSQMSLVRYATWEDVSILCTDMPPPFDLQDALSGSGVECVVAESNPRN